MIINIMIMDISKSTLLGHELSVGFETNLDNNADRKFSKYRYLLNDLASKYRHVNCVNLSVGSIGIFGQSCNSFIQMCSDLTINKSHTNYIITKLKTITDFAQLITYSACATNPGLAQTFYPDNVFLSSFSFSY